MATSALSGIVQGQAAQQTPSTVANSDAFANMGTQQFIQMMITELQNQDPTSPMDNSQILQEIGQIESISSTQQLSNTLTSMQLQQDMTSGAVLLNRTVTGLNASGNKVSGTVSKVTVAGNAVQLQVGQDTIALNNVSEIDG